MFGRKDDDPKPQGRYYVQLVEGSGPIGDRGSFQAWGHGMYYNDAQRELQQKVQTALDRGHSRGWKLINATSPAATLSVHEGVLGCISPTVLFWDTEG